MEEQSKDKSRPISTKTTPGGPTELKSVLRKEKEFPQWID